MPISMWRRALWIAGALWVYSWAVVWLEIYRWHHMTRSFRLNPPPTPPGLPPPHPGMFLLSARVLGLAAPAAFVVVFLILVGRARMMRGAGDQSDVAPRSGGGRR